MRPGLLQSMCLLLLALLPALPCSATLQGQSIATNAPGGQPLSTRVVNYTIDAHIDTDHKTLDATETLTYRNLTGQPLSSFPFHLYLNAFRPESTFTNETHLGGGIRDNEREDDYPARKLGSITIAHIDATSDGYASTDLTPALHFTAPDDGNANDHTVAELTLPRLLAPGAAVTFNIRFHDQFPESVARNGYKRDFLMGGQWYPKLGVFWHGAWNCHQYHATTEFFSDFGIFHVRLTLPRRYQVGASGVPTDEQANPDGTRTLAFYGEDIHDFAWAASPHFQLTTGTYLSSMGPVQVRVLALAANPPGTGQRYLKILLGSLAQFDQRYGPYPYKILTLIDPEPGSEIGGMEYPTLITGDTGWLDGTYMTEITAEHEFGHQYWYGMVATNEFEDAWLDEGINSYSEGVVTGALLGPRTSFFDRPWANASDADLHRTEYIADPSFDPVTRHAWQFRDSGSYGAITYGKSGTLLRTLAGLIGQDTMNDAMRTYFLRFRFTHPTTEDFLKTIEEVAIRHGRATGVSAPITSTLMNGPARIAMTGQLISLPAGAPPLTMPLALNNLAIGSSLRSFFNQAVYGTEVMDYAVDRVVSEPVAWWKPLAMDHTPYRDTVTVRRLGDFRLPVTVEVVFDDGSRVRETWDPGPAVMGASSQNDRWHSFTYIRPSRVLSAEIDPDHILLLDRDRFNNSYTTRANPVPARKLTNLFSSALQLASQCVGWLV